MIQKEDRKAMYILPASTIASLISALIVNPLDVLKVRQQKGSSQDCHVHNRTFNVKQFPNLQEQTSIHHNHNHHNHQHHHHHHSIKQSSTPSANQLTTPSISCSSIYKKLKKSQKQYLNQCSTSPFKQSPQYSYVKSCLCLDKKSIVSGIAQIWRMEGVKTFFNGLRYSLYSSTASTVTYFYFYETFSKQIRKRITENKIYVPLLAAVISRYLTTTLTFPLEYFRTVQQAQIGFSQKSGFQLGNRVFSAYFVTLQRDIIFSSLYWVLAENIRDSLHGMWCSYPSKLPKSAPEHQEYHRAEQNSRNCQGRFMMTNIIAGSVAGGVTALITLPLDVIKTKRQLYEKYAKNSSLQIMKEIVETDGIKGLYAGVRPRIAKVVVACSTMLSLYEYFLGICKSTY